MAGIKKINPASPGVLRPVQVSDLQDIWDAIIESLASGSVYDNLPQILSGFKVNDDNTLTSGVVSSRGQLYYYDDSDASGKLSIGSAMFAGTVEDSERTLADGSVIPFYTKYKIQPTSTGLSNVKKLLSNITSNELNSMRVSFIPPESIGSLMIADGAIGSDELASGAVTQEKIADGAVGYDQIADRGVGGIEKVDNIPSVRSPIGFTVFQETAFPNASFVSGECEIYTGIHRANVAIEKPMGLSLAGVNIMYICNTYSNSVKVTLPYGGVGDTSFQLPANKTAKIVASISSGEVRDIVYEVTILDAFNYEQI